MSKKQLVQKARDAFDQRTQGLSHPITRLEIALKGRGLTEKSYAQFVDYAEQYRQMLLTPFQFHFEDNKHRDLKSRDANLYTVGLTPNQDKSSSDFLRIRVHNVRLLGKNYIGRFSRNLPIEYGAQKTEFSYIRNTASVINYDDEDTQFSFVIGIAASNILGEKLKDSGTRRERFILPHPQGLLKGYARRPDNPEDFCEMEGQSSHKTHNGLKITPGTKLIYDKYTSLLRITSFIPIQSFDPEERRIHETMMRFFEDENQRQKLRDVWTTFQGAVTHKEFTQDMDKTRPFIEELRSIINSEMWQEALEAGAERSFNPNQEASDAGLGRFLERL